jgi:hypothetical protein
VLGFAKRIVRQGGHLAGSVVSEVGLLATSIPGGGTIPVRRIGFGVSMVMDPRGSTLLEVLGDDLDERAHTMDRFLDRCSEEEVCDLLNAFQEAAARRAARTGTTASAAAGPGVQGDS